LDEVCRRNGWGDVVIKPAVGGTARLTEHTGRIGTAAGADHLSRLLAEEDAVVQPVIDSITADGEVSVVAIAGEPVAAFLKRAAPGDWRVQTDFGGTVEPIALTGALAAIATVALDASPPTTYARVDVVRLDGRWTVLELELVEPELFFRFHRRLAERLVDALLAPEREAV
jgi:glutathione synthase/RimK-type ligase-like ATP-grasp enzyme